VPRLALAMCANLVGVNDRHEASAGLFIFGAQVFDSLAQHHLHHLRRLAHMLKQSTLIGEPARNGEFPESLRFNISDPFGEIGLVHRQRCGRTGF
jgi:hypothetical protein